MNLTNLNQVAKLNSMYIFYHVGYASRISHVQTLTGVQV